MNHLYIVYAVSTIALLMAWSKNLLPISKITWLELLFSILPFPLIIWCTNNLAKYADLANESKANLGWLYIFCYFAYLFILLIIGYKSQKYLNNKYWSDK